MEGKVCLVTGAGGGLGLALVKELCRRKCGRLILWDIKEEVVKKAKEMAVANGNNEVEARVVDLSKRENIYDAIDNASAVPHFVFNVAGIISGNYVCDNSDDFDALTFQVNTLAHLWVIKKYLPMFEKRGGEGHFVNVSSFAAFVGASGMVSYAGSKSGAMMIAQALNHELRHRGSKVKVTSVCPSHFHTPLFEGFEFLGNISMSPDYVAWRTVEGALAERELVLLPQYLIPSLFSIALFQMNGYLNVPSLDGKNPMQKWGGSQHANEIFKTMGAKL